MKLLALLLALSSPLALAPLTAEGNPAIRLVPVEPTPEPSHAELIISFPGEGEVKDSNPVNMQMRVQGFPIGTGSDFERTKEIYNDPDGQSVHIIIDNEPYFAVHEAFVDALDNNEVYFDQTLDFDIPIRLKPGAHVIRAFPVRSYNESLKDPGCFTARTFYFQKKTPLKDIDLSGPYLTYNEPQDEYDFSVTQPILLDFYITNCQLSQDGYKVNLFIDGTKERTLTRWAPCYIYGLKKGHHKVRLQLIDPDNKPVPGVFNDVTRTIKVQ